MRELSDEHVEPIAGNDIQLTIDLDIQQYAEQALRDRAAAASRLPTDILSQDIARPQPYRPEEPDGESASMRRSRRSVGYQEWMQYKAPAGSVVVQDHSNGQIAGDGQLPDVRQPLDGGGHRRRQVRRSCSARRSTARRRRPRQVDARQPRRAGPLQPGLDHQAVRRLVGDARRRHRTRRGVPRRGRLQARHRSPKTCCATRLCAASSRTPPTCGTQPTSSYGPVTVADALAVSRATRSSTRLGEQFCDRRAQRARSLR